MADQANRVYRRKRLKISGSDTNFVDVPVIYEARFKTVADQAQETFIYFDNSSNSSRKAHTKRIANISGIGGSLGGDYLDVERIDEWSIRITQEQAQEYRFFVRNTDPPPIQPDGSNNPAHERVHYVRYFKDNDSSSPFFIDCELIDQLKITDTVSQAQEWVYYLLHPQLGDTITDSSVPYTLTKGYCDPSLPLAPDESGNGIDPPYRLDLFQNVVNVGGRIDDYLYVDIYIKNRPQNVSVTAPSYGTGSPFPPDQYLASAFILSQDTKISSPVHSGYTFSGFPVTGGTEYKPYDGLAGLNIAIGGWQYSRIDRTPGSPLNLPGDTKTPQAYSTGLTWTFRATVENASSGLSYSQSGNYGLLFATVHDIHVALGTGAIDGINFDLNFSGATMTRDGDGAIFDAVGGLDGLLQYYQIFAQPTVYNDWCSEGDGDVGTYISAFPTAFPIFVAGNDFSHRITVVFKKRP